jgi:hypothetical protein
MDLHGLGMKEVMGEFTTRRLGATYFWGSVPIDAVWATSNVTVVNACVMPVGYGVGDHCLFVMDFVTALLVRTGCSQQIVRPALHCLNTRIAGCALRYNKALQRNILRHHLLKRMVAVATSDQPKAEIPKALNKLDKEGEAYMKHAEKKSQIEVWLHPLFSGSVTVDPAKSGVPLVTALACWEDTQSRKLMAHGTALSNQCTISVDSQQYQTQTLYL